MSKDKKRYVKDIKTSLDDENFDGTIGNDKVYGIQDKPYPKEILEAQILPAINDFEIKNNVNIEKSHPDAKTPHKAHKDDAAYDLYSCEDVELKPYEVTMVNTGLKMEIPKGHKGEVYSRSGLASKGVFVVNQPGKIDSGYRGEIKVLLLYAPPMNDTLSSLVKSLVTLSKEFAPVGHNMSEAFKNFRKNLENISLPNTYYIKKGDRIAQFEVNPCLDLEFKEGNLSSSERGTGGFGSSG